MERRNYERHDPPQILRPDRPCPSKRPDGSPWVTFAGDGKRVGWVAVGSRTPQLRKSWPFWTGVVLLASEVMDVPLDYVCSTEGGFGLTLGALGLTETSGMAQYLLIECLRHDPIAYLAAMTPVIHAMGMRLLPSITDEGVSMKFWKRDRDSEQLLVECISRMLRDQTFDVCQEDVAASLLPNRLPQSCRPFPGMIREACVLTATLLALAAKYEQAGDLARSLDGETSEARMKQLPDAARDWYPKLEGDAKAVLELAQGMQWLAP